MPWVGVDLDGTLAEYDGWRGAMEIGKPIPAMVEKVKQLMAKGVAVRIFTARVADPDPLVAQTIKIMIQNWCFEHVGAYLPVTNVKDYGMVELWDDRAVQVVRNSGEFVGKSEVL